MFHFWVITMPIHLTVINYKIFEMYYISANARLEDLVYSSFKLHTIHGSFLSVVAASAPLTILLVDFYRTTQLDLGMS